jgi:hypothetical protein
VQRYIDIRRIHRQRQLAKVLSFGGLGVLVLSLILSLRQSGAVSMTLGLALLGLLTSQMGSIMMRRWPDHGRPDQVLDAALKGLDGRNALYHYLLGGSHALLTPAGCIALVPVLESGLFEVRDGTVWRTKTKRGVPKGKPSQDRYLPDEAERQRRSMARALAKQRPEQELDVLPVLVFLNSEARLETGKDPLPAAHAKKLKDYLRGLPKRPGLSAGEASAIGEAFAKYRVES